MTWIMYALLSAFFAAITSILAKIGVKQIDSNLATAIRTVVITMFAWGIVFSQGLGNKLAAISKETLIFLILSGLATGTSWIFYFKALQLGEVNKVVPIDKFSLVITIILATFILHEKITLPLIFGISLITIGTLVITLWK